MNIDLNHLTAFAAVAEHPSFSRAAAQLNVTPSALSQTIAKFEAQLGRRLLARTTRAVALTAAGAEFLATLPPRLQEIHAAIDKMVTGSTLAKGTLRITAPEGAATQILAPFLAEFLPQYPQITVEIAVDHGFDDIVAQRFDAGIRLGEDLAQDMVAMALSAPMRMAVVGALRCAVAPA